MTFRSDPPATSSAPARIGPALRWSSPRAARHGHRARTTTPGRLAEFGPLLDFACGPVFEAERPDRSGAPVGKKVVPYQLPDLGSPVHVAAGDRASLVPAVLDDRHRHSRRLVPRGRKPARTRFELRPAEVVPDRLERGRVDLLPVAPADVAEVDHVLHSADREPPRVPLASVVVEVVVEPSVAIVVAVVVVDSSAPAPVANGSWVIKNQTSSEPASRIATQ